MTNAPAILPTAQDAAIRLSFSRQGLMQQLEVEIVRLAAGEAESRQPPSERVIRQQGGFHGGATGALAGGAAGYAAMTLAPEGQEVTTVEYKIHFLAPFTGGGLGVAQPWGRSTTACAVMQQTIAPMPRRC